MEIKSHQANLISSYRVIHLTPGQEMALVHTEELI